MTTSGMTFHTAGFSAGNAAAGLPDVFITTLALTL
jgi:hypothetical protein